MKLAMIWGLQPAPRRPYFTGWCLRASDATTSTSIIVGCFSPAGSSTYSSHLAAVETRRKDGDCERRQKLLDDATLVIESGFDWTSSLGRLTVAPTAVSADLDVDGLSVSLRLRPDDGWDAEGWVGRLGRFLPCRYNVLSLHAPCDLVVDGVKSAAAVAHVEGNCGASFPSEWVWLQAASNEASLLAVGGNFKLLGPFGLRGYTWLLVYRSPKVRCDFRSTDLVSSTLKKQDIGLSTLVLVLEKRVARREKLRVEVRASAPPDTFFSDRLYVPTRDGFSNDPGTAQSFQADVQIKVVSIVRRAETVLDDTALSGAALEFGGDLLVTRSEL